MFMNELFLFTKYVVILCVHLFIIKIVRLNRYH